MKTFLPKVDELEKQRKWYLIDAEGKTLGRVASEIAKILRGKNKAIFTPHLDTGDYVVVVNAEKVVLTGKKLDQKYYRYHTGYPGGLKEIVYKDLLVKKPTLALEKAVKGMLPKNKLGRAMYKKLKVVAGPDHKFQAQQPVKVEL